MRSAFLLCAFLSSFSFVLFQNMDRISIADEQKMYAAFEKAADKLEAMNKFIDEKGKKSEKYKILTKCFSDFEKMVSSESKSSQYTREGMTAKVKDWQRPKYFGACLGNPQNSLVSYLRDVLVDKDAPARIREDSLEEFSSRAFTNNRILSILNNPTRSNYRDAMPVALRAYFGEDGGAEIEKLATEVQQALLELQIADTSEVQKLDAGQSPSKDSPLVLVDTFMLSSPERLPAEHLNAMKNETVTAR